jgi:hypothetical protein
MKQNNTECQGVQKEMKQNTGNTESQYSKQVPMENSGLTSPKARREELTDSATDLISTSVSANFWRLFPAIFQYTPALDRTAY